MPIVILVPMMMPATVLLDDASCERSGEKGDQRNQKEDALHFITANGTTLPLNVIRSPLCP
jgi:hypothetical protein